LSFSPARGIEGVIDASLAVMCGLLAHVGANCVNTYFDFKSGLDRPSTSDDRALVDNLVSERT
jgi:1,4-dihydroxy-2-naphthoate octaprenyltransferase